MIDQLLKKMEGAYADNTIKAYRTDFKVFASWCRSERLCPLPAEPETICGFISFDMQASTASTIRRRMASIRRIHKLARVDDPTKDEDVFLGLRRMHRKKGRRQRQAFAMAQDIRDQLIAVTDHSIKGYRDRALLLFAYDSMRRRSVNSVLANGLISAPTQTVQVAGSCSFQNPIRKVTASISL